MLVGFLAVAALGAPLTMVQRKVMYHYADWTRKEDDLANAFRWIARNTPANLTVILPPWRKDSFYLSQRGQIANWHMLPIDRVVEWKERLESLVGDLSDVRNARWNRQIQQMEYNYNQLTPTDIASIRDKYGAEYLVSSATPPVAGA